MSADYVIGLDFGTDSVRGVLVDAVKGGIVATAAQAYPRWREGRYSNPSEARFRHHPLDYLETLTDVCADLHISAPKAMGRVRAISLDTTAATVCLTDSKLVPLALKPEFSEEPDAMFVLWKDHSAAEEAKVLSKQMGFEVSPELFWPKVLHVLRNPALAAAAASAVELEDWLPALLTGCEDPEAVVGCLVGATQKKFYDPATGRYPDLCPDLKLTRRICTPDQSAGTITSEWAKWLGLPEDVQVGVGNIDSHAGAVGAGIRRGVMTMSLGTSSAYMSVMEPEAVPEPVPGVFGQSLGSILPGYVGFESGLSAFGDVYAWLKRFLAFGGSEEGILARLNEEASQLVLAESSPLATPHFNGRRSPAPVPGLRAGLVGLSLGTTPAEIYLALVEATAHATRSVVDNLVAHGIVVESVVGTGGISRRSPLVVQMVSDAIGRDIQVTSCDEPTALGSAIWASVVAGIHPDAQAAQEKMLAPVLMIYQPDPARAELLKRRYVRYLELERSSMA